MNLAATRCRHRAIALDHGGYLFALVRMNQKYYFVVPHFGSLWVNATHIHAWCSKEGGHPSRKIAV
jgi:hypothetical protein